MKAKKWDIVPYSRAGTLLFGLSQEEARNILGKEQIKERDDRKNETILYWEKNSFQLVFDNNELSMISFYPYISNIFIEKKPLIWKNTTPIFNWLLASDPAPMKGINIFVFFKFGVALSGFDSEYIYDKSITAFRKEGNGVWSPHSPLLRPFKK